MDDIRKNVSLLIPCYNVERYLQTFFNSVLIQSYLPTEIIAVDDGSTDNTAKILKEYVEVFKNNGIDLHYIYKPNGGLASAISVGLKLVTGDYLIWADPDDLLLENSILFRVNYLNSHPECGIVRSNGYTYSENDLTTPISKVSKKWRYNATLNDYVKFVVPWCCGCYMVRMSALDDVNPERLIYDSPCGQNIQMLLPVVSKYPCHFIDEYLYGYVLYGNSHSRKARGYEYDSQHIDDMKDCVVSTLAILNGDYSKYILIHDTFNRSAHYQTAWRHQRVDEMQKYEKVMRDNGEFYIDHWLMKYINPNTKACLLLPWVSRLRRYIFRQGR